MTGAGRGRGSSRRGSLPVASQARTGAPRHVHRGTRHRAGQAAAAARGSGRGGHADHAAAQGHAGPPRPHEPRQGAVRGSGHLAHKPPQSGTSRSGACFQAPRLCRGLPQLERSSPVFLNAPEAMGRREKLGQASGFSPALLLSSGAFASIKLLGVIPSEAASSLL